MGFFKYYISIKFESSKVFIKSPKTSFHETIGRVTVTQYMYIVCEMLEYFKGVIRNPKLKKERRYNNQRKKCKRTNNDIQNTTQKTQKTNLTNKWGELRCSERVNSSCSTGDIRGVALVTIPAISHE